MVEAEGGGGVPVGGGAGVGPSEAPGVEAGGGVADFRTRGISTPIAAHKMIKTLTAIARDALSASEYILCLFAGGGFVSSSITTDSEYDMPLVCTELIEESKGILGLPVGVGPDISTSTEAPLVDGAFSSIMLISSCDGACGGGEEEGGAGGFETLRY